MTQLIFSSKPFFLSGSFHHSMERDGQPRCRSVLLGRSMHAVGMDRAGSFLGLGFWVWSLW